MAAASVASRARGRAPDGLVIICEDQLVGCVVEQLVLRLLGLEVLLEVMHATVEAAKLVDALLVLETHLHVVVVVVRLRARTRGVSRGVGARAREERRTIVWRTRVREVAVE